MMMQHSQLDIVVVVTVRITYAHIQLVAMQVSSYRLLGVVNAYYLLTNLYICDV